MDEAAGPVAPGDRIDTLDMLRGVAVCGILLMNIGTMGMAGGADRPPLPPGWTADWIAWTLRELLFEGTMRGLFGLLFGAGMVLMLRGAEREGGVARVDVWTRRCLALLAFGVVDFALLLWPDEILWCYGVSGLLLLAFRAARPRALLLAAALALGVLTVSDAIDGMVSGAGLRAVAAAEQAQAAGRPLDAESRGALADARALRAAQHPAPAAIERDRVRRTHLATLFEWSCATWVENNLSPARVYGVIESLGTMLVGAALFRAGVLTGAAPATMLRLLMLIGYGGGVAIRAAHRLIHFAAHLDPLAAARDPVVFVLIEADYQPARLLLTLGHAAMLVTMYRAGWLGRAAPLRALGRMALTVYMLQSLLTSLLFYGLGMLGRIGFAGLMGVAAAIWVLTAAFCMLWLRRFDTGPAEALLRGIAYARRPRLRRRGDCAKA